MASRISSNAAARTWPTVPGALSIVSSHMVWMESITTSAQVPLGFQRGGDVAHVDGGGQLQRRVRQPQPAGAQAHLVDRFLARDVADPARRRAPASRPPAASACSCRSRDRRPPAPRRPARSRRPARGPARRCRPPRAAAARPCPAGRRTGSAACAGLARPDAPGPALDRLLDQGVPLAAGIAPPGPFRVHGAAVLADVAGGGLSHGGRPGRHMQGDQEGVRDSSVFDACQPTKAEAATACSPMHRRRTETIPGCSPHPASWSATRPTAAPHRSTPAGRSLAAGRSAPWVAPLRW